MRVTFVSPAPTAATAATAFPDGEPLDARGREWAARAAAPRADRAVHGPDPAAAQTAAALGTGAVPDPALACWDLGGWAGARLADLAADRPAEVTAWLTDPDAAPHGGEPLRALLARAAAWLAALPEGHTLAVCDGALARAAVVGVLGAPPSAFWRIEAGPLTRTDLRGGPHRWTVRATGAALA